ncbi:MAG TPA: GntR family transcriptional regulator [Chthoniobacteraceae bacterium]|nr:GntR family transcriptional regulator [Chthoniobacteraceae bacterium]
MKPPHSAPKRNTPLYRQVADLIFRDYIDPNPAGTRLPSLREAEKALGVSSITIRTAYDELEKRGCLERRHGSGSYSLKAPADHKHVALLLENSITNKQLSPVYPELLQEVRLALLKRNISSRTYLGYLTRDITIGELTCREVLEDLRLRRINCLVPICATPHLSWYNEFEKHSVPIFWPAGDVYCNVGKVLEHFRDKGCRTVAIFGINDKNVTASIPQWKRTAGELGLHLEDSSINLNANPWYEGNAADELRRFWEQTTEKPDGLLFADDLLFKDCQAIFAEADLPGISKTEIAVIGTDAVPLTSRVPALWYQVSVQSIVHSLVKAVEAYLQGKGKIDIPLSEGRFKPLGPLSEETENIAKSTSSKN